MGVPYESKPHSGLHVLAGQSRTFAIPFPSRVFISKVVCKQYNGPPTNFTLTLFNHPSVMDEEPLSESESEGDERGPIPEECYLVGPPLSSDAPGKLTYFTNSTSGGPGMSFYSQYQPQPGERSIGNRRMVYARITAEGGGDNYFALVLGGESFGE